MNAPLFGICISALLSSVSLLAILLRVSPLTAPVQAVLAFMVSVLLTTTSVSTLAFYGLWHVWPHHGWDTGKIVSISLRQGILLGLAVICVLSFHLLSLLNWWIAILIIGVFTLVEVALEH